MPPTKILKYFSLKFDGNNAGVTPRKRLGQHFLIDANVAQNISNALEKRNFPVLEIGPGTGSLTRHLFANYAQNLFLIEADERSVTLLKKEFPTLEKNLFHSDVLSFPLTDYFPHGVSVIGNLPYNIASQILLLLVEQRNVVHQVVCMLQKEVAQRVCAAPGKKQFGILSVLLQTFFSAEYLFQVPAEKFYPVPKVNSAVIRLMRNERKTLPVSEAHFRKLVKTAFSKRRKKLRNTLANFFSETERKHPLFDQRAEQLSVAAFIALSHGKINDDF